MTSTRIGSREERCKCENKNSGFRNFFVYSLKKEALLKVIFFTVSSYVFFMLIILLLREY